MQEITNRKDEYKSYFDKNISKHLLLNAIKKVGQEKYEKLSFPDRYTEEWKYTNVKPILNDSFKPNFAKFEKEKLNFSNFLENEKIVLTFVDGNFVSKNSKVDSIHNDKIIIGNLADIIDLHPDLVLSYINDYSKIDNIFNALNTSLINDGAFIYIPDNIVLDEPILINYISGHTSGSLVLPRNLFVIGKNSQVKIITRYFSQTNNQYFVNSITEINLGENSKLELYKITEENNNSFHIDKVQAVQSKYSNFNSYNMNLTGAIIRNDINVNLKEENAEANLMGFSFQNESQHFDNHTLIEHSVPNCLSNEIYKAILKDNSSAVFNGKIIVKEDAQKTLAYQSSKTILLSDKARMDAKPQLEIFADDVKCSHGATIGKLDDISMFYLRSRGIPEKVAEKMLLIAFLEDITEKMSIPEVVSFIQNKISERL